VFDFGGGTVDIAVLAAEDEGGFAVEAAVEHAAISLP
jgi:molecular chaperone DnaK (HSP70)